MPYSAVFQYTLEQCDTHGYYCRNTGFNPYTAEGKKTVSFEIIEQFNRDLDGRKVTPPLRH